MVNKPLSDVDSPSPSPQKARLREQLAKAFVAWHYTTDDRGERQPTLDDEEGWKQRRYAVQLALGAFYHWAKAHTEAAIARDAYAEDGIPAEHLRPLIEIITALGDLNCGKNPELLSPPLRGEGNPGLETGDMVSFAAACAAADFLPEEEVARLVGMRLGAFRSRRKAFKSGRRGGPARDEYHEMHQIFRQVDAEGLRRLLKKKIWGFKKRTREPRKVR
jgi:hypothetical protein